MRVNRLIMENFRGQKDLSLRFQPGFNLVIGENGAGKTSILDALRILLARALPSLSSAKRFPTVGFSKSDLSIGRDSTSLFFEIVDEGDSYTLFTSEQAEKIKSAINPKDGIRKVSEVDELVDDRNRKRPRKGDPRLEGTMRGQTREMPEVSGVISPAPKPDLKTRKNQPLVMHFSVRRSFATEGLPRRKTDNVGYSGVFEIERGLELKNIVDWWKGREALAAENSQSRPARQLVAVRESLGRMLPELSGWEIVNDELRAKKKVKTNRIDSEGVAFVESEELSIAAKHLSDGERSLIALCVDIAYRLASLNEGSEDPLNDGSGVVLIDEIDLHLHPKWQRRIAEDLRRTFPGIQFICTTHSPFVVQSINDGELIRLDGEIDAEYSNKSVEDVAEDVMDVKIPQRSSAYVGMMKAATEYYRALHEAESNPEVDVEELKRHLDGISVRYSDNPFFAAGLNFEWESYIGGRSNAAG